MKVHAFTTGIKNNYIPHFRPDCVGQMVTTLPDDEVKDILYLTMPNIWRKKMTKKGYNNLNRYIQEISGFFETRV